MAFYVVFSNKETATWYVGSHGKPPVPSIGSVDVKAFLAERITVVEFQANGHELDLLLSRFANIPYSYGHCEWRGEMAQFLFDNLKM
jgi:hypothetical protein